MLTFGGEIASLRGGLMRVLGMIAREGIIWLGKALSVLLMGAVLGTPSFRAETGEEAHMCSWLHFGFSFVAVADVCMYDRDMRRIKRDSFLVGSGVLLLVPVLLVLLVSQLGVKQIGTPLSGAFTVENRYRYISAEDGRSWQVIFQWPWDSTFEGSVRHISRWNDAGMPFMSHDILVTSGGFADASLVKTSVRNHHYFYTYTGDRPDGDIHLLHVFPASGEVLEDLLEFENGKRVRIRGREIFLINVYDAQGKRSGFFTDTGCNTILVTAVEIIED